MKLKTFTTERLHLRPAMLEDAPFVLQLLNMPKWLKYIGDRNVNTIQEAEAYIASRMLPQYERLGYGNYTVIRKEDQKPIGCCGLYDREGLDGVDIGFSFLPEYEGKGYAYESSNRILKAAFEEFHLNKVGAITLEANESSRKLLKKLGLKFIAYTKLEGDAEELMYYEVGRE